MHVIGPDGREITISEVALLPDLFTEEESMPDAADIIITHLKVESFGGLKLLDLDIPPGGVVLAGTKGLGKTTALRAVRAVLEGEGVGADAIHFDEKKATLTVDFTKAGEAMRARRSITRKGTSVDLEFGDGTAVPRAREQLRVLFGERPLDPLALMNADPKARRAMILQAMPCKVTSADINRWCGTSQEWNTDGHGQEVLSRVREKKFAERSAANAKVDDLKARLKVAQEEAAKLKPAQVEVMSPEAARTHVAAAERVLAVLDERRRAAEERERQGEATRQKIAALRADADELLAMPESVGPDPSLIHAAEAEQKEAAIALEEAQKRLAKAMTKVSELHSRSNSAKSIMDKSNRLLGQADELEAAVAHTLDGDGDPIALQAVAAEESLIQARALVAASESTAKWREATDKSALLEAELATGTQVADALDVVVTRLTKEAPAELAKQEGAIPGLEITPTAILFEGKNIDRLSEGEKLIFCVEVTKRATSGAKVLCIDGLERLPPTLQPGFIRKCLEGGWMVFGTRVQDGGMEIVNCYTLANQT